MSQIEGRNEGSTQLEHDAAAARQRRRIAQLEEKLEALESGRAAKNKQTNYFVARGRAIRRVVTLFDNIEDLVNENDRRCETDDQDHTLDQDRLQIGYGTLTRTLPWFHKKGSETQYDEYLHMLKMLWQGADSARGDDTSKLKNLVAEWVNRDFKPTHPVDPDDKHSRGFTHDVCGKLLCPAELDWNNLDVRTGIRDRSEGHVVTDLSFPAFLYDKYTTDPNDLEEGLFKGKILIQGYKAVFTSPSSAKDVAGDGDGADVIRDNTRAKKSCAGMKVKKHVRFALSSVTSWRSIDGDFDYVQFWRTIVDFFEKAPGREAQRRVNKLLEWWTRKIFGRNHRDGLSDTAKANMSVNTLTRQRAQRDDAAFDSP
ncbi:uncharacterized protein F5891DRAFT_961132 [Suillus fuscotomentosus]|uniref:Uncharacterized protein n=1 Tax=Suillus fuscotomentosus TaxID=1912939 RepID=A0AAD4DVH6_9AGAM|nr:uncharacterized protein F5891DRAFT_961132 [Suillus fuscotomentosus]KAG1894789.1 hypothetical protein F5891DRAFT_961132 [Suillus fuscotomentosus]